MKVDSQVGSGGSFPSKFIKPHLNKNIFGGDKLSSTLGGGKLYSFNFGSKIKFLVI